VSNEKGRPVSPPPLEPSISAISGTPPVRSRTRRTPI